KMAAPKKAKLAVRSFQPSRTDAFGFTEKKDHDICAFCYESVKTFLDEADKTESIKKAVAAYEKQSGVFKSLSVSKNEATEGSYKTAQCVAKKRKPFTDGEYVKEVFLSSLEILFNDLPNKDTLVSRIKELPVSARTVERRKSKMAENSKEKQTTALKDTAVFSVAVDESVDINDVPRLAVVARYCASNEIQEELCCVKPLPGTTKGEDIVESFVNHFEERGVDIRKIFCVTTDGAPAVVGKQKGFVKLLEDQIGRPTVKFHSIIHQDNLCTKISNSELNNVMNTVVRIGNFLVARSALTHRQFQALLEEMDSAYNDIPLHSNIRWLSRGKVLVRFVNCFDAIEAFLSEKEQNYPELDDDKWLCKLMFLTDITAHLNELNLCLQGAFVVKLAVFSRDIQPIFRYFQHIKDDLDLSPFQWMGVEDFEMQLIQLKSSELWASKFVDLQSTLEATERDHGVSILTCWMSLPMKFNCLKKISFAMLSAFGSTYLCEQVLSHMKSVLSPSRSRLTTDHSEACVQLKVPKYEPHIGKLSKEKQGQGSH
uniref:DUF4371 domain-containing protein n=1 Tax=Chelydra serpentina TaxID=8475 RepID=A0A8C3TK26_CHESE